MDKTNSWNRVCDKTPLPRHVVWILDQWGRVHSGHRVTMAAFDDQCFVIGQRELIRARWWMEPIPRPKRGE